MVPGVSVTLTQLRSFLAVVRTGSVSAAAAELVVTQPSVSAAVDALSREARCARCSSATGAACGRPRPGREFAAYAADVIGLLEQGARAARAAEDSGGLGCASPP